MVLLCVTYLSILESASKLLLALVTLLADLMDPMLVKLPKAEEPPLLKLPRLAARGCLCRGFEGGAQVSITPMHCASMHTKVAARIGALYGAGGPAI